MRAPIRSFLPAALTALALGCGGASDADLAAADAALDVGEGPDAATACVFTTQLRPEAEVRTAPVTDPVDSVATGHAQVKLRTDGTLELRTFLRNPAGEAFVAGHVHEAPAGANAPPLVPLFSSAGDTSPFLRQDEAIAVPADVAARICATPERFYVNYHTTADPQGATRGQLR